MGDTETNVISKSSIKRLVKDIKELKNDPLKGIFYRHNEANMLKGSALIIGPDDTPYRGGYYLFSFMKSFPFAMEFVTDQVFGVEFRMVTSVLKSISASGLSGSNIFRVIPTRLIAARSVVTLPNSS